MKIGSLSIRTLVLAIASVLVSSCGDTPSKEGAAGTNETVAATSTVLHPKPPTATGAPRILFIGNSHINYYISIPKLFSEFCDAGGVQMEEAELLEMGASIDEIYAAHKEDADKMFGRTDADGNYFDYVVIQEKTPVALMQADQYKAAVKMMVDKVRKNSPGSAVYVYQVMSPENYTENKTDFNEYHREMKDIALTVVKDNSNTGLYRVSDGIKDAYDGKNGYQYKGTTGDNLRHGENTLHLTNDGGFLAAALLYATLFDKKPTVPEKMTLATGTGDSDEQKIIKVADAVSNPAALVEIAYSNR